MWLLNAADPSQPTPQQLPTDPREGQHCMAVTAGDGTAVGGPQPSCALCMHRIAPHSCHSLSMEFQWSKEFLPTVIISKGRLINPSRLYYSLRPWKAAASTSSPRRALQSSSFCSEPWSICRGYGKKKKGKKGKSRRCLRRAPSALGHVGLLWEPPDAPLRPWIPLTRQ